MASPTFPYLSDDPQGYLLFLKDYIRPCTDICTNCKVRCLDNFIKTASAPDLGWNRLSPDERPRPAHSLLDAQLANLAFPQPTDMVWICPKTKSIKSSNPPSAV